MTKCAKLDRRAGRRLVNLADNDEWGKCLSILLRRKLLTERNDNKDSLVWLGATTDDGDGLLHLAAFACCESAMKLRSRQRALQCLELVLQGDRFAVNRVAGDGGTALHAAIAAASSSLVQSSGDNSDETSLQDASDDSSSDDSEWEDEEEWQEDNDDELEGENDVSDHAEVYNEYTSFQVNLKAIELLLSHGADPNIPLRNDLDFSDVDEDEIELIYSREAVIEQWTPFTLGLLWVALASMLPATGSQRSAEKDEALLLSLMSLKRLLEAGANPAYAIGANVDSNATEFVASCSHCFKNVTISCDTLLHHGIVVTHDLPAIAVDACMRSMLSKCQVGEVPLLSAKQAFAAALIANNSTVASEILANKSDEGILERWRAMRFIDILPMPQATWCANEERSAWSLLSACAAVKAIDSVRLLVGSTESTRPPTEQEVMDAITVSFSNEGMAHNIITNFSYVEQDASNNCNRAAICSTLIDAAFPPANEVSDSTDRKQMFMDRLLLRACSDKWGTPDALEILIALGADPNADSVISLVQDNLRPLHFIAANCRGRNGASMANLLLDNGASVFHGNAHGESPLRMSLRHRNFLVVTTLWEASTKEALYSASSLSLLQEEAFSLAEAGVACRSLPMLQEAVTIICGSADDQESNASDLLGKLLLRCIDERSGFGAKANNGEIAPLVGAVNTILGSTSEQESDSLTTGTRPMPTFAVEEVTGHSPIHLLLRVDRGTQLRAALLPSLCKFASIHDSKHLLPENVSSASVNLRCDAKFGSYTALHLACALGCSESIATLVRSGADITALDGQGKLPQQLIPPSSDVLVETVKSLGLHTKSTS